MAKRTTKRVQDYISVAEDVLDHPEKDKKSKHKKLNGLWNKMSDKDKKDIQNWVNKKLERKPGVRGVKHLVECVCSLFQYRDRPKRVFHKFPAWSLIDEDDEVIPKYAQCNNCGQIHRIIDIGKSEFTGKDESPVLLTIEEIKRGLPGDVIQILDENDLEIPHWEEAAFILENHLWGSYIVIRSEEESGESIKKLLRFTGPNAVKIETVTDKVLID